MSHAVYSPSGAHRWWACPGSLGLEQLEPNTSSSYAREGTAAHLLAAKTLDSGSDINMFLGAQLEVEGQVFVVDQEMTNKVGVYVNRVRECAVGGTLYVEHKLYFGQMIGQKDEEAYGTGDAVVLLPDELQVHDLKYGRGERVDAYEWFERPDGLKQMKPNKQLGLYALGAMHAYALSHEFRRVRLFIHQPRLNHLSESLFSVEEMGAFAEEARAAAALAAANFSIAEPLLVPGEKQCRWCRRKAKCPALQKAVLESIDPSADGDDSLATLLARVDMIEDWCRSIRERARETLLRGDPVPGYKLVEGKKGNRSWVPDAEPKLKASSIKRADLYTKVLATPAQLEKKLKKAHPRQWATVQALIHQAPGQPTIAPESDPRPAVGSALDAMDDLSHLRS